MADPECLDADPDPTFQADVDQDPKLFELRREKKISSKLSFFLSIILQNLSCVIFSVIMQEEEGQGVRDKV